MKTWKDIEKQFDELREEFHSCGFNQRVDCNPKQEKQDLHSTLDEYVRELIGEEEEDCWCALDWPCKHEHQNDFRQELLKQHEINLSLRDEENMNTNLKREGLSE